MHNSIIPFDNFNIDEIDSKLLYIERNAYHYFMDTYYIFYEAIVNPLDFDMPEEEHRQMLDSFQSMKDLVEQISKNKYTKNSKVITKQDIRVKPETLCDMLSSRNEWLRHAAYVSFVENAYLYSNEELLNIINLFDKSQIKHTLELIANERKYLFEKSLDNPYILYVINKKLSNESSEKPSLI